MEGPQRKMERATVFRVYGEVKPFLRRMAVLPPPKPHQWKIGSLPICAGAKTMRESRKDSPYDSTLPVRNLAKI
jgi:hypothetical protein